MTDLKYFIGKPCTISTIEINFRFKPEQMNDYFVGIIESIDDTGISMYHPITKCKNYIFLKYVVAIAEEQILYEDNPEHAEIIKEYKKEKPITAAKNTLPPDKFIHLQVLSDLAKKVNQSRS